MANAKVKKKAKKLTMTPKHNFDTLPAEVFEAIAREAGPYDLLSLRLVNTEAAAKVFRVFIEVHIARRAFMLSSEDGLRGLLAIAENESLAQHVKQIVLCVDWVCQTSSDFFQCRFNRPQEPLHAGEHMQFLKAQRRFAKSRLDHLLLTAAFARFRQLGSSIEVLMAEVHEAIALDKANLRPLGLSTLGWAVVTQYHNRMITSKTRGTQLAIDALALSNLQPATFTIHESAEDGLDLERIVRDSVAMKNAKTVFSSVKRLHLQCYNPDGGISQDQAEAILDMFAGSQTLEELSWEPSTYCLFPCSIPPFDDDFSSQAGNPTLAKATLGARFPAVKHLKLSGFRFHWKEFVAFTRRQQKLEHLQMCHIGFESAGASNRMRMGEWSDEDLERRLKDSTGLKSISLKRAKILS